MILRLKQFIIKNFFKRDIRLGSNAKISKNKKPFELDESYSVALYFNSPVSSIYQLEQWLLVLKELNKTVKIALIVRTKSSFQWLIERTDFTIFFAHTQRDLMETYEQNHFKVILYVNNGVQNFQSLSYRNALHVHINHGESEKTSTISNQINAYNYVFVVGDSAYDKYLLNLLETNKSKFIKVGRPQLEHVVPIEPLDTELKVVLYAPTWEGTHESMNYTSLNKWGLSIVQELINSREYYILYKPHPNTGYNDKETGKINQKIMSLLDSYESAKVINSGDINALYEHIDIAIFDNSAIAIDYLSYNKPMLMTDFFYKVKDRQNRPMIVHGAVMLSENNIDDLLNLIQKEIENDTLKENRERLKRYVLGDLDYQNGESTSLFISTIVELIEKRDSLLVTLQQKNSTHKSIFDD